MLQLPFNNPNSKKGELLIPDGECWSLLKICWTSLVLKEGLLKIGKSFCQMKCKTSPRISTLWFGRWGRAERGADECPPLSKRNKICWKQPRALVCIRNCWHYWQKLIRPGEGAFSLSPLHHHPLHAERSRVPPVIFKSKVSFANQPWMKNTALYETQGHIMCYCAFG